MKSQMLCLILLFIEMLMLTFTTSTMINEVFNDYNEMSYGRGYHYDPPPYSTIFDMNNYQQHYEDASFNINEYNQLYHSVQDQHLQHHHHQQQLVTDSNSYMKSPLFYLYTIKQFDIKPPKENVAFTTALQMSLTSRPLSNNSNNNNNNNNNKTSSSHFINHTSVLQAQTQAQAQTQTQAQAQAQTQTLKTSPSPQSINSNIKYSTRQYVNLKLPLPYDKLPLNVPQLPLQSGASYAMLPRGVTSYDLPPHPLR